MRLSAVSAPAAAIGIQLQKFPAAAAAAALCGTSVVQGLRESSGPRIGGAGETGRP